MHDIVSYSTWVKLYESVMLSFITLGGKFPKKMVYTKALRYETYSWTIVHSGPVHTYPNIFESATFLCGFGFCPQESEYESASFSIRCAEWKFLNRSFSHDVTTAIFVYKTMNRWPCLCTKTIPWELNSFHMLKLPFISSNLQSRWPCDWKRSIRYESGIVWTLNPDMFLSNPTITRASLPWIFKMAAGRHVIASFFLGLFSSLTTCVHFTSYDFCTIQLCQTVARHSETSFHEGQTNWTP